VNQRALSLAKQQMLQRRDREELLHTTAAACATQSSTVMPVGSLSAATRMS
jgi:hypothetical protein